MEAVEMFPQHVGDTLDLFVCQEGKHKYGRVATPHMSTQKKCICVCMAYLDCLIQPNQCHKLISQYNHSCSVCNPQMTITDQHSL